MKQLIIILLVLAVALIIVVGCKGKKVVGVNREDGGVKVESIDSAISFEISGVGNGGTEWWNDSTMRVDSIIITPDTLPFLNVLKDTTFKLSRMKTFEFFIGDAGDMVARKHLNGEWEVLDCGRALNVILKMNKEATNEIEKLEAQLDGFRSAYRHDDIRPMDYNALTLRIREKATFNYKYNFK